MFCLINLINKVILDIDRNLTKRSRNKERIRDSREATIIVKIIIVIINYLENLLLYCSKYAKLQTIFFVKIIY